MFTRRKAIAAATPTFTILVVASMVLSITAPIFASTALATGSHSGPSCPLAPKAGRTIIDFPSDWRLRSDQNSQRQTDTMNASLPAGTYDVTLVSYDKSHPAGGTQPQEQWYLEGFDSSDDTSFETNATSDLDDDEVMATELVETGMIASTATTKIRAVHAAPKSAPTANSITPICASFDKVVDSACKKIEGGDIGDDGTVTLTNGVVVTLSNWETKSGGDYVGFDYSATGPISFTVKAGTSTYTVEDVVSGSWEHPGSHQKGISNITFCPGDDPKECELEITKSVDRSSAKVGDTLTYRLEFENVGDANCTGGGVKIEDDVHDHLEYLSEDHASNVDAGYNGGPVYSGGVIRWDANTLKPGEDAWVEWKAKVKQPARCGDFEIPNTARITARELNNFKTWVYSNEVKTSVDYDCDVPLVCPFMPQADRIIIDFPDDWRLRSDINSQRETGVMHLGAAVPAGIYNISLASFDKSHPAGGTQPQEQWYLNLQDGGGGTVLNSNATTDLPDNQQALAEKVQNRAILSDDVAAVQAFHAAPKSAPTANSITPICAALDKQPDEPTITLVKTVVNDDGGTAKIGDFVLKVGSTVTESGKALPVAPGTYTASEVNLPGYDASNWGGDCDKDGTVTVDYGDDAVCEITNDDKPQPTIKLVKKVINDDGGTAKVGDFTLKVDSTVVTSGVAHAVAPGTYAASEIQHPDYDASVWSGDCAADGSVTVDYGDKAVCEITNNDKPAPPDTTITLVKNVINNNGGTAKVSDFTLKVGATTVTSGVPLVVAPGSYNASEVNLPGYTASAWSGDCAADGSVTLNLGDDAVCEITNDDNPDTSITLIKHVVNDDGGTATVADFVLRIGSTAVTSGVPHNVLPGTYTASEVNLSGYAASSWSGDCAADGSVTVAYGDHAVCEITNNDNPGEPDPATITLIKHVINNNGGTASVSDFPLFVNSTSTTSGTPLSVAPGTYTASETTHSGYNASGWSGDCTSGGVVTVAAGENAVCEITNDDVGGGGSPQPKLTIVKTVDPTFTNPGTSVTYTITVKNESFGTAVDVTLEDVLPPQYFSYADGTSGLVKTWDLGNMHYNDSETVTFDANVSSAALEDFYTNTATVQAINHGPVSDTAVVEVRDGGVQGEEFFPKLQIVKTVSPSFTTAGGTATYTITVRNIGEAVALNVVVTDVMPKELTETVTGLSTLNWSIGNLAINQEWSVTYTAKVADDAGVAIYRNIATADADNADPVQDPADLEVRAGEVLGIEELPETGAFDGAMGAMATISLTSLLTFGAAAGFTLRRRNATPEQRLAMLTRKLS